MNDFDMFVETLCMILGAVVGLVLAFGIFLLMHSWIGQL